jgi:hypothetical protein
MEQILDHGGWDQRALARIDEPEEHQVAQEHAPVRARSRGMSPATAACADYRLMAVPQLSVSPERIAELCR